MTRRKRKGKNDDLLEPFRKAAKEAATRIAAGETGVDIVVKGPLIIDQEEAALAPITLGALIVQRIKDEMTSSTLLPQHETIERRKRALKSGVHNDQGTPRYPGGYQARPQGAYGDDSGYLRTALTLNVREGKADVFAGIPKNRQKAAFIIRRVSPTAGAELPGAVARTTTELIKTIVRKTVAKAVRKELRGTGARIKVR